MMDDIKIYDNFLKDEELSYIIKFLNGAKWGMQRSDPRNKGHGSFLKLKVTEEEYFNSYILNRVYDIIGSKHDLATAYFNGQWFGQDGNFHKDGVPISCLIYINQYDSDWGGFTQFKKSEKEQFIVPPIQRRLVVFPGDITHKAYAYSRQTCPMRISLAYKLL
jgi:hypothetical protein